jgi:hypothetical protein
MNLSGFPKGNQRSTFDPHSVPGRTSEIARRGEERSDQALADTFGNGVCPGLDV